MDKEEKEAKATHKVANLKIDIAVMLLLLLGLTFIYSNIQSSFEMSETAALWTKWSNTTILGLIMVPYIVTIQYRSRMRGNRNEDRFFTIA